MGLLVLHCREREKKSTNSVRFLIRLVTYLLRGSYSDLPHNFLSQLDSKYNALVCFGSSFSQTIIGLAEVTIEAYKCTTGIQSLFHCQSLAGHTHSPWKWVWPARPRIPNIQL